MSVPHQPEILCMMDLRLRFFRPEGRGLHQIFNLKSKIPGQWSIMITGIDCGQP